MAKAAVVENRCSGAALSGEEGQLQRWLPLVRSRANAFRENGVEADDLVQEGLIGLLYAVRAYDERRGASFETFAYHCITNRMRSAVVRAARLSGVVSLEDTDHSLLSDQDPQDVVVSREQAEGWLAGADMLLSRLEGRVLRLYLAGYSYRQMAKLLKNSEKTVDNALCRAKSKLRGAKI